MPPCHCWTYVTKRVHVLGTVPKVQMQLCTLKPLILPAYRWCMIGCFMPRFT
jgi:hypothetical protein